MIDPDDKKRFRFIMEGLAEDKGVQLSASGIGMKFEALKSFDIEDINRAALSMMANKKFSNMPAVSDFLEHLGGGNAEDRGQVQAAIVWQSIVKYGGARSIVFDDPVTMAVIHQGFGGWQKLCRETEVDKMKWFIKDFTQLYGSFSRSNVKHIGFLAGYSDPVVAGVIQGPVFVGDPQKCLALLEQAKETPMIGGFTVTQLADKLGI